MGYGIVGGIDTKACFYCDTTENAFGPVFESGAFLDEFVDWMGDGFDPRGLSHGVLEEKFQEFKVWKAREEEHGSLGGRLQQFIDKLRDLSEEDSLNPWHLPPSRWTTISSSVW